METLDSNERESNLYCWACLIRTSLDDNSTEETKVSKILELNIRSYRRLCNSVGDRKQRILVTVASEEVRNKTLEKARALKDPGEVYHSIYIKRDVHPSVRAEWKRQRDAERKGKERLENAGYVVRLDTKERKLYRDGVVIDTEKQQFF